MKSFSALEVMCARYPVSPNKVVLAAADLANAQVVPVETYL
jgi:hypothetical protein